MVNKSQLCDNECLNPIPRGQRRIIPIPESPFVEFTTTTLPPTTTTTTTTTLYPTNLNNQIIYPNEDAPCPIVFPKLISTSTPPVFGITGGIVRTYVYDGVAYRSHTFNQTNELGVSLLSGDPSAIFTVDVLIVAGGGGGGGYKGIGGGGSGGGGGGAGGFVQTTTKLRTGNYLVVVGDGGSIDQNGQNSSFNQLMAYGGGAGGSYGFPGKDGGSGGGAGQSSLLNGGKGVQGQGFDGGAVTILEWSSGGGGGASESALPITQTYLSSKGGNGKFNNFMDGTFIYYAGGGGGSSYTGSSFFWGQGGSGGGGSLLFNRDGQVNTGGGGAGGVLLTYPAGKGGSGTVIVRYRI
jgi:hypothetical protein